MEKLNGGYVALVLVGLIFLGLQFWWLSLTIRSGNSDSIEIDSRDTNEIKKKLERIFRS